MAGAVSGSASIFLIALINHAISRVPEIGNDVMLSYVGLMVVTLLSNLISQLFVVTLAESAVYRLRLKLSQQILACPLRQLETLGPSKLLATLSGDTLAISASIFSLPLLCINITLEVSGLIYLSWLSGIVFGVTLLFLIGAIAMIQWLITLSINRLKRARNEQDQLFKHFRAITDGIKELKLHRDRRQIFFQEELKATAGQLRNYRIEELRLNALLAAAAKFSLGKLLAGPYVPDSGKTCSMAKT